jgi:hypothetical protein
MHVEGHPLDYIDFKGEIPECDYRPTPESGIAPTSRPHILLKEDQKIILLDEAAGQRFVFDQ